MIFPTTMAQNTILYKCANYTGTVLQKYPLTFVPARVQKNIVCPTQSKKVFCSMKSERSRVEYCSVAVSVPVVSDVEPSFLIDSQWSGSRATVGRINYLMKKNWLRASDAQKKEMRFSLQILTLYRWIRRQKIYFSYAEGFFILENSTT